MSSTKPSVRNMAPVRRYLLFMIIVPFIVAVSTKGVRGRGDAYTPPQIVVIRMRAGLPVEQARIDALMQPWLADRLADVNAHKSYIDLSIAARGTTNKKWWGRPADPLWLYYIRLRETATGRIHDVALWGLAYCEMQRDSMRRALSLLERIQDRHLPYLQLSRGVALHGLGDHAKGDAALHAAVVAGQGAQDATTALAEILLKRHDWNGLATLRADPHTKTLIPHGVLRALDIHAGAFAPYLLELLLSQKVRAVPVMILLALYSTVVWFFLIRWWDAFEKEPPSTSLLAVAMGAISPLGIVLFHDVVNQFFIPDTTGVPTSDFLYFFLVVGGVEECVKIVPVFVLGWLAAREMNERVDWMIYGCLSALGFSLNENYGYLVEHGLQVGAARFFLATPLHLSLTGCLALTLRRIYLREPHAWRRFAATLVGVALIHGTFDFLLNLQSLGPQIAALILGPLWGLIFLRVLGKVVSASPFRKNPVAYRASCTSWFMAAYAVLCVANYAAVTWLLGPQEAAPKLVSDLVGGQVFLLLGLVYSRLEFMRIDRVLLPDAATTPGPAAQEVAHEGSPT